MRRESGSISPARSRDSRERAAGHHVDARRLARTSFTELRDALSMTDGNLTTHIRTLQEAGYVAVAKSFQNNRPLTTCSLTTAGRKAFADYVDLLEKIIQQTKEVK